MKHGHARKRQCSTTYAIFHAMKGRCLNPSSSGYYKYGARGIRICSGWASLGGFERFLNQVGVRPSDLHSIERIDNSANYSCGKCVECLENGWVANCRWATRFEQGSNKRNNRTFQYRGVRYTIAEAVREFGIPRGTLINRHRRGWSGTEIVTQPKKPGVRLECR